MSSEKEVSNNGKSCSFSEIDARAALSEEAANCMASRIVKDVQSGAGTGNEEAHKDVAKVVHELTELNDPLSAARVQRSLTRMGFPEIRVESSDDGGTVTSDIVAFSETKDPQVRNRAVWLEQRKPGKSVGYEFDQSQDVPLEAMFLEAAQNGWSDR